MKAKRMLDLFSGLGGASAAFKKAGWDVIRVDINPDFQPDIIADLSTWLPPANLGYFDLVWASPPCTYFSRYIQRCIYKNEPIPSLHLVEQSRKIIKTLNPEFWVIENVRGAVPFIGPGYKSYGSFYLWSNLPELPARQSRFGFVKNKYCNNFSRKLRAAKRGEIPFDLSNALMRYINSQQTFFNLCNL